MSAPLPLSLMALIACTVTLTAPLYAAPGQAAAGLRMAGFAALDADDLRSAEARFAQALARDRTDADARGGLGVVRLRQRRFSDAAALLAEAARGGRPRQWSEALATARYYAGLEDARLLLAAGRLDDARRGGEALLAGGYAQDAEARELLAGIAAEQGRHADAAALYRSAARASTIADAPRLAAAASRAAARVAVDAGDLAAAESELRTGLAVAPADVWLRHDYAHVLVARGHAEQAAEVARPLAVASDPQALLAAALIARELDRPSQAEALLSHISPADRTLPIQTLINEVTLDAEIARAHALAAVQGPAAAVAEYRRIADRPGIMAERRVAIAGAVLALGDGDAAASIAEASLRTAEISAPQRAAFADILARSGRLARASGRSGVALVRMRAARAGWPGGAAALPVRLDAEIEELWRERADRVEAGLAYRHRSGEVGLGRLDEAAAVARASVAAGAGRVELSARAVALTAGAPRGDAPARFGLGPTLAALGLPRAVGRQHASGVEASAGYLSERVSIEIGATAVGSGRARATGRLSASTRAMAGWAAAIWAERKPLTDSIVAYAGVHDPAIGVTWGRATRTSAGLSLSFDRDGSGLYAQARHSRYDGMHVRTNAAQQIEAGGYLRVLKRGGGVLTAGLNLDVQHFRHDENGFTLGTGGYFSPQRFVAVSLPVRYRLVGHDTELSLSAAPGFQSYREAETPFYPADAGAQAAIEALASADPRLVIRRPAGRAAGVAFASQLSLFRYVGAGMRLGAESAYDSFGSYREWRLAVTLRASFGRGG